MTNAPEYLTVAQVAAQLAVSESLVRRWVYEQSLPAVRLGAKGHRGTVRVAATDLAAFLAARRTAEPEPQPTRPAKPARRPRVIPAGGPVHPDFPWIV